MGFIAKQISDGKAEIKIVKGDTFIYPITIYTEYQLKYIPGPGDRIIFQVHSNYNDNKVLLEKHIRYDDMMLVINADETEKMKVGNYVFFIRIEYQNHTKDTVLSGPFSIVTPGGDR